MGKDIIGRIIEQKKITKILKSNKSELIALYGRRRVGKTFLIKEYFNRQFQFAITGLANATTKQQLFNFDNEFQNQTSQFLETPSENWLVAFNHLIKYLDKIENPQKKIIFIDELPWFDTNGTDFMIGLEHFWNSWANHRKDIILIVCGSAASWMINNLINNTGGLHNRVTQQLKIDPFTLAETELFLQAKECVFEKYQIAQLYMVFGGIPFYLDAIDPALSAAQNIQEILFSKTAPLRNEFYNLYRSLYKRHEVYEKIVETLATKIIGLTRSEIAKMAQLHTGGTLSKVLLDLEESGFIESYFALDGKLKNKMYRLSDYYSLFYFKFLNNNKGKAIDDWLTMHDSDAVRIWEGLAFEQLCMHHIQPIKKALGIHGIKASHSAWRGATENKKAQIDLLIDRADQVINICECKFANNTYEITADDAGKIRERIAVFKNASKTKKAVYFTMITTFGMEKNKWANALVQNEIVLNDLFV